MLYEQLYNELISSGSNKRDRDASDGYVDEQEFKVRGAIICPRLAARPVHLTWSRSTTCDAILTCTAADRSALRQS